MTIGATLHASRHEAGLSLDDVATSTRIRASLIRQIEADNFEGCGGATYARGHIRSIAAAVGADAAPLVAEFNSLHGAVPAVSAHQILDRPEIVQGTKTGPNWTAAMFVTAVLLAAVAVVGLFTGPDASPPDTAAGTPSSSAAAPVIGDEPGDQPAGEEEPVAVPSDAPATTPPTGAVPTPTAPRTTPSAAASPAVSTPPATSGPPEVVAFNGVNVRVSVTGARCWVRATDLSNARKVLYQGVLERGTVRDFTATSKLSMTFGDAGAVTLTVNGRDLGSPGGSGKVVTIPFVPGNPGAG